MQGVRLVRTPAPKSAATASRGLWVRESESGTRDASTGPFTPHSPYLYSCNPLDLPDRFHVVGLFSQRLAGLLHESLGLLRGLRGHAGLLEDLHRDAHVFVEQCQSEGAGPRAGHYALG